jgi:Secretion system C-terminal sorting domain
MNKSIFTFILLLFVLNSFSQQSIFEIINREDISFADVNILAKNYFENSSDSKESEKKHYERWKYERKFHLDENGFFIKPEVEESKFNAAFGANPTTHRIAASYTELGPWSWTYTSGWNPGVGRITCIAVFPADTTIIYVSSPGGGIWKSVNSAATWQPLVDNNSSYMNVYHLAINPTNSNIVYAGLTGSGVIKSIDGGTSWASTGSGPSGIKKILIDPTNANILFATSSTGIHRSINAGTSWTSVQSGALEDIEFMPGNVNIMYASGSGTTSIYRSINAGVNWTALTSVDGILATGRTLLGVSAANPTIVYAVQASGSVFGRMYISSNTGISFSTTVIGSSATNTNYFGYTGSGTVGQATHDMAITVNPLNASEVHIAGIICWKSIDAGRSFSQMTAWSYPNGIGYNHADVHGLEWVRSTMYSCSDGGVYKSTDYADNWINLSTGLGIRQLYKISTAATNGNIIVGGAQDNGTVVSTNSGTWRDWLGADGMDCTINPTNENIIIGTSQFGNIYKTTNGGSSYFDLFRPVSANWVTPITWHPTNNLIVYGGWNGIYKSTDQGSTWTNLSSTVATGNLDCLKIAPSNDNYIYASAGTRLFVTTNGGVSWNTYTQASTISSIEVKLTDPAKVWITLTASTNNVLVSTNAGSTFTSISAGLPSIGARCVVVDDTYGTEAIYVGMNIGVYTKDLIATSWLPLGAGLPKVAINEIEISKNVNKLRIGTYGRGVWEIPTINSVLPINWISFGGKNIDPNAIKLDWVTTNNNEDVKYIIQHSSNGRDFVNLGNVKGKSNKNDYSFIHNKPSNGNNFYRIIAEELGTKLVSSIILIRTTKDAKYLTIVNNPVNDLLKFSVKNSTTKDFVFNIFNINGALLFSNKINSSYNEISIGNFNTGTYILEVNIDGELFREKFVKQ